jgi:PAS domain S-box-containing protein
MNKSKEDLLRHIAELENRLIEAEETIEAIKFDKVDALLISTTEGERVYTLNSAERPYRIFLEQMSEGAVTLSPDGLILFCNLKFAEILQEPREHVLGSQITDWVFEDTEALVTFLEQRTENHKEEINFRRSDGSCISLYLSVTFLKDNTEPLLCLVATDLTEKKRSEEIVAAEKLARSILDQAGEAIVVCDEDFRIIRASKAAETLAGEPVLYKYFDLVFPLFDDQKVPLPIQIIVKTTESQIETALIKKESQNFHLILNIGILRGPTDNIIGYVINMTNITRHIEAEEKLSQSLKEKTLLLKEIHHRVKNNLQIISSLLRLQSLYVTENHVIGILNECQNRINSMALIHQQLYESKSFATISFNQYLKELVVFLCNTYMINSDRIELLAPEEDVLFSIDIAVPLGLIINELVTNSFKHAFNEHEVGKVIIHVANKNSKDILITIKDNGRGFPEELDFFNPSTLGLQLIHSLTEQISGIIKLMPGEGTHINLTIPKEEA